MGTNKLTEIKLKLSLIIYNEYDKVEECLFVTLPICREYTYAYNPVGMCMNTWQIACVMWVCVCIRLVCIRMYSIKRNLLGSWTIYLLGQCMYKIRIWESWSNISCTTLHAATVNLRLWPLYQYSLKNSIQNRPRFSIGTYIKVSEILDLVFSNLHLHIVQVNTWNICKMSFGLVH